MMGSEHLTDIRRYMTCANSLGEEVWTRSGSIRAALTNVTTQNFPKLSIPCLTGTSKPASAMSTFTTTFQEDLATLPSATGLLEAGHCKSFLRPTLRSFVQQIGHSSVVKALAASKQRIVDTPAMTFRYFTRNLVKSLAFANATSSFGICTHLKPALRSA
jgi:hypothetical protein